MEIVSHRAVWSLFFCLVALGIAKQLKSTYALLKNPKVFFRLLLAAGLILALAFSWGSYGLVKKQLNLGALEGLAIETLLSLPFYGGYLIYIGLNGTGQLGSSLGLSLLLIGAGVVTAIPLLLFNGSTTRLPFTIIGLLQYITPTIQFSIGVWVRHEDMPTARWVGFMIIWAALITLAIDLLKSGRTVNNSVAQG